jgi:hypothetical protein
MTVEIKVFEGIRLRESFAIQMFFHVSVSELQDDLTDGLERVFRVSRELKRKEIEGKVEFDES